MHTDQRTDRTSGPVHDPELPDGVDERFSGHGALGVPFASGHYLTLRRMTASSIGPGYTAVWHRNPRGEWVIYTTAAPELSCPRYFSYATRSPSRVGPIAAVWDGSRSIDVTIPDVLDWHVELADTPATRLMTAAAGVMPEGAWRSEAVLRAMGRVAGPVLGVGRIRLRGRVPNGQHFQMAPRAVWAVSASAAVLGGEDLGEIGPLPAQERLGDFWMPQRGLFASGTIRFQNVDRAGNPLPVPGGGRGKEPQ